MVCKIGLSGPEWSLIAGSSEQEFYGIGGGGWNLLTGCTSIRPYLVNIYCMELFTVLLSYLVNYTFECPLYTSVEETASGCGEYQRIC